MQQVSGNRLRLRLFLEGMEVPVIAAQVQCNLNAPATAAIQVIPVDKGLELKTRTMVHLFFYDFDADQAGEPPDPGSDEELQSYDLLFSGEVIGLSFVKTPGARQMVLQCADFSTYWDTCYQLMITYSPNGNFLWEQSSMWAAGNQMFDNIMSGHGMVLSSYLKRKPKTPGLTNLSGLMGGMISLLEAMGGVPKHSHGVNDFFTIGELKNHILQQLCCEQNDDTAQKLFSSKQFWEWLMGGGQSLGELCTFRDMLMLLCRYIYYEVVPVTCPKYIPAVNTAAQTTRKTYPAGRISLPGQVTSKLSSMITEAKQLGAASQKPTGATSPATSPLNPEAVRAKANDHLAALTQFQSLADMPKVAVPLLQRAAVQVQTALRDLALEHSFQNWDQEAKLLERILNITFPGGARTVTKRTPPQVDRLQTQIIRPDCFFAPPPRCNVVFPEHCFQFSYSRMHLQEITRLRLALGWWLNPSGGGILGSWCFAPSRAEIDAIAKKQSTRGLRALLPWEIYSGILPKFEKVNDINFISNKRNKQLRKGQTGKQTAYGQRVANWNYMKYRFAARSAELVMRFNPRFVVGFPAVVLDRPWIVPPETAQQAYMAADLVELKNIKQDDYLKRFKVLLKYLTTPAGPNQDVIAFYPPTQYLGMVATMTHNVDQKGGVTSAALTTARTHRITEDDFLSLLGQLVSNQNTKLVSTQLLATEILEKGDYARLKLLIDATPQDIPQEMQSIASSTPSTLSSRPTGSPKLATIPHDKVMDPYNADQAFLLLNLPAQRSTPAAAKAAPPPFGYQNPGGWNQAPLRGKVTTVQLQGTQQNITVPAGAYTIKKGPSKGSVVAVQLFSDAVLEINPTSLGKFSAANRKKFGKQKAYVWLNCVLWEEVQDKSKYLRDLPIEESLRPQWFSPLYSSLFIGEEIYQPFFGCGAITDEAVFAGAGTVGIFGANRKDRDNIMAQFKAANGNLDKIRELVDKAKAQNLGEIPSVETAVDALAYTYGEIRRLGLDVHRFVADYTYRPIATMYDIFGSTDLEYVGSGNSVKVKTGKEGFHSAAIAELDQLQGLLDNPGLGIPRVTGRGKPYPVDRFLDPRPGRRGAVKEYVAQIAVGRGRLGSGLRG